MGLSGVLAAGAAAVTLAACGGGGGGHGGASTSDSTPATPTINRSPVRVPPAFAGHLLRDNELPGFLASHAAAYTSIGAFVAREQLDPVAAAAETRMLAAAGFRGAAQEELDRSGVAAASLAERFAAASGARQALRFDVSRFRRIGARSGEFAFFGVAGVPGAVGFRLGSAGAAGSNVAFADGDYYYLLGEEGSGPGPQHGLVAAARHLYRRVHG